MGQRGQRRSKVYIGGSKEVKGLYRSKVYEGGWQLLPKFLCLLARHLLQDKFSFLVIVSYVISNHIFNLSLVLCLICNGPRVVRVFAPQGIIFIMSLYYKVSNSMPTEHDWPCVEYYFRPI